MSARDKAAEVILAARVTGCCVDCPHKHGNDEDQAAEIVDVLADAGLLAEGGTR